MTMFVWALILMDCCLMVGCLSMVAVTAMRQRQRRRGHHARQRAAVTDEPTEPASVGRPAYRGPFRTPGLGTRVEEYERRGTDDFFAGEYRPRTTTSPCAVCTMPAEHCLCRAEPDRLRDALAQISSSHQMRSDGRCAGCGNPAARCGYITLLHHLERTRG
jgi:hypothetical protein